jgi:hypothetical protein
MCVNANSDKQISTNTSVNSSKQQQQHMKDFEKLQ